MQPDAKTAEALESLVHAVQDLFILQALEAGITTDNVRAIVGVDQKRVLRISKVRRKESGR